MTVEEDSERAGHRQQPSQSTKPATPTHSHSLTESMAAMSLSGELIDGGAGGGGRLVVGGGAVDCAPLIASLLAELECAERLRRVQDRVRDEMDSMLRLLAAEVSAAGSSGKQGVEVDVVS